jgi:hypothetical protein
VGGPTQEAYAAKLARRHATTGPAAESGERAEREL